jgi:S-formylglutathione hydrolase FrmB
MASIDCKFFSDVLGMSSSMRVLLPEPSIGQIGRAASGAASGGKHPVLYLLHGLSDDETIWTRFTAIERYVAPLGLAVVMPNVHRSFYTNMKHGYRYWDFVSDELLHKARSLFPLSSERRHNFVAGLSMGGYGALKLGLSRPELFAAAASLSGSCELTRLHEQSEELALIFGDASNITRSGGDLGQLARELAGSARPKPKLYQCCGKEDSLLASNRRFRDALGPLGFDHVYEEGPGLHDWAYWDAAIQRVLAWLPLA